MKEVIKFLAAAVIILVAFGCERNKKVQSPEPEPKTHIQVLEEEYNNLVATRPDVVFYTSMIELDTTCKEELVVENFINVYQDKDTAIVFTHTGDSVSVDYVADHWMEDVKIDLNTLTISLEVAWDKLMQADIVKPNPIHKVCLRSPLGPKIVNPMYIFGQGRYFVAVDAMTGDVKEINATTNSGYKNKK